MSPRQTLAAAFDTHPLMNSLLPRFAATAVICLSLPSCDRLGEREAITESREISTHAAKPNIDIPSATRFFDDAKNESKQERPDFRSLLTWTVPDG